MPARRSVTAVLQLSSDCIRTDPAVDVAGRVIGKFAKVLFQDPLLVQKLGPLWNDLCDRLRNAKRPSD
eukprot:538566-Alexandrium_andersonii.AAC.1